MATLFDILKPQDQPQQPQGMGEQTGAIRNLLQAKTGKQPTSLIGGAKQSNISEQIETQSFLDKQQEQQKQSVFENLKQQQQGKELEQQQDLEQQQTKQAFKLSEQDYDRKIEDLIQRSKQQSTQMDMRQREADAEQMAFLIRNQNQDYINKLNNEASRARLSDETEFKKHMAVNQFNSQIQLLKNNNFLESILNDDKRTFLDKLADMDISSASAIADNEIKAASAQSIYSGLGNVAQASAEAYTAKVKQDRQGELDKLNNKQNKP